MVTYTITPASRSRPLVVSVSMISDIPDDPSGRSGDYREWRNRTGYHGTCSHQGSPAQDHSSEDRRIASNRRLFLHDGLRKLPLPLRHELSSLIGGFREIVIDEHDSVAHEHSVADSHARAYEAVARDLAVATDRHPSLNLDEGTNLGALANTAAIEVDQIGMSDLDTLAKNDVITDQDGPDRASAYL